jgi:hypothetical protein
LYAAFLNTVVHSTAFMQHSQYLAERDILVTPDDGRRSIAATFAAENTITLAHEPQNGAHVKQPEPEDNDEDEEFPVPTGSKLKMDHIRSWIKILVEHFTAARMLQHHCSKLEKNDVVNISVIVIQGPCRASHPKVNWEGMKDLITKLNNDTSMSGRSDLKKAIQKLEDYVQHVPDDKGISKSQKDLRRLIIDKQSITLYAKYHCETLLLALIKFPDATITAIHDVLNVCPMFYVLFVFLITFTSAVAGRDTIHRCVEAVLRYLLGLLQGCKRQDTSTCHTCSRSSLYIVYGSPSSLAPQKHTGGNASAVPLSPT